MTDRIETIPGTKAIAERIVNAHLAFIKTIMTFGNISKADAVKVKDFYLKNKIAKLDPIIGRISVKHGAFLEAEIINRAVNA